MYPQEYIDYLVHFHGDRDYFECHELLEEYWKKVDRNNKESILVGFIQLAVSNYHHRRENFQGAYRTLQKAVTILQANKHLLNQYGFETTSFMEYIGTQLLRIKQHLPYQSTSLPIVDKNLLEECKQTCEKKGFIWASASDLANYALIHRHSVRDRSAVIKERQESLQKKIKGRGNF